jgi:hypothetical protein
MENDNLNRIPNQRQQTAVSDWEAIQATIDLHLTRQYQNPKDIQKNPRQGKTGRDWVLSPVVLDCRGAL